MYLYSTSEFRSYLNLFVCLCRYKFRLCWICYESVQFQNEKLAVVCAGEAWTDFPLNISGAKTLCNLEHMSSKMAVKWCSSKTGFAPNIYWTVTYPDVFRFNSYNNDIHWMFSCRYVTWSCLKHAMFDRWVSFTHESPRKSNIGFKAMLEMELKWRAYVPRAIKRKM